MSMHRRSDRHVGSCPASEESLGFFNQGIQNTLDWRSSKACGKQCGTDFALAFEQLHGALAELSAAQAKHCRKVGLIGAAQKRLKGLVRQGSVILVQ